MLDWIGKQMAKIGKNERKNEAKKNTEERQHNME